MLKTLALTLGIASIAGVAAAQNAAVRDWSGAPYHPGSVAYPREDDPAWRRFEREVKADLEARRLAREEAARTGEATDVSAVVGLPPPADWTRGEDAWRDHMRRCAERYRTYDAETDLYYARPGVQQRCRL